MIRRGQLAVVAVCAGLGACGDRAAEPGPTPPPAPTLAPAPAPTRAPAPPPVARPSTAPQPTSSPLARPPRRPAPPAALPPVALIQPTAPPRDDGEDAASSAPAPLPELAAAPDAPADTAAPATAPRVTHSLGLRAPRPRRFGVGLDLGVPDGATAELVVRPLPALRLDAGLSYNGVSHGVRAGITWVPLGRWITPTVSLAIGHYSEGDANPLARLVTGDPMFTSPVLDRVGYDFTDAQVGVEVGRTRVTVYLRAGATRVTGNVHDLGALVSDGMAHPPVVFADDPRLTVTAVSARVGLIFYLGGDRS